MYHSVLFIACPPHPPPQLATHSPDHNPDFVFTQNSSTSRIFHLIQIDKYILFTFM